MNNPLFYYFPDYFTNGAIFSKMPSAPWNQVQAGLEMDIVYLGSHSGIKLASDFIYRFTEEGVVNQQKLADTLWKLYGHNWQRLWDAYMSDYDPLENYNTEESIKRQTDTDRTIDRDITESGTVNSTDNVDSTTTTTDNGTSDTNGTTSINYGKKIDASAETDTFTHAFNTVSAVPTGVTKSTSEEKQSGTDITTDQSHTGTINNGTITVDSDETVNTTTSDTTKDDTKDNTSQTEEIVRTRKGNIGQNTYQELLRQEFDLWKFNFFRQVFQDCDSVLCLRVFSDFCGHIHNRFSTVN